MSAPDPTSAAHDLRAAIALAQRALAALEAQSAPAPAAEEPAKKRPPRYFGDTTPTPTEG